MVTETELIEALEIIVGKKGEDDSLISHLSFIGIQLEKISKSLERLAQEYKLVK